MFNRTKAVAFLFMTTLICFIAVRGWTYLIRDTMNFFEDRRKHRN